jgi:DNA-binding transcriptional LysR family regulator
MKDWDDYRLILALYRSKTLRGTAQLMGVNHTTISRRLTHIDRKWGTTLFERTSDGYRATESGLQLINTATQIEDLDYTSERQIRSANAELSGKVVLSIPGTVAHFLLLEELGMFTKMYPQIELEVVSSYQFADLDRSEADIVIRGTAMPPDHLVGHKLFPYSVALYANKHYVTTKPRKDWCLVAPSFKPEWIKGTVYENLPISFVSDDPMLRHTMIKEGQAIGRNACYMADQEPNLVRLSDFDPIPTQELWVLTHPDLRNTPRIKTLMTFLYTKLQSKKDLILGISGTSTA